MAPLEASGGLGHREPLRLGVIGLGAVAQAVHLPLLAKNPGLFRIAAICDVAPSVRDAVGERFGVPPTRRFAGGAELIASGDLDAVAILTSGSHAELALVAAEAGLAIFCEKPLAYTVAEADALVAASPTLMLGYMKLFDPAVERGAAILADRPPARSIEVTVLHPPSGPQLAHAGLLPPPGDVDDGVLGRLRAAEQRLVELALGDAPDAIARLYVDVLLGSVVHDLAVVRALAGGPLTLSYGDTWSTPEAPSVALLGQLPGGTRVSIRWHYLEDYPAYREEIRVHDDRGTVALAFPSPYLLHAPTVLTVGDRSGDAEHVERYRSTTEAFERQWLAFADYAAGGAPPRAGLADGRADTVVCQAAARLLAGGRVGGEARDADRSPIDTDLLPFVDHLAHPNDVKRPQWSQSSGASRRRVQ